MQTIKNDMPSIDEILHSGGFECPCGRKHTTQVKEIAIEPGAIAKVSDLIRKYGGLRAFVFADTNTYREAARAVCTYLEADGLPHSLYVYDEDQIEPDAFSTGQMVLHYDPSCDFIVAVGSGTINDLGKILAKNTGHPYMIVATAPSMDGYASATSSVVRNGIKLSLDSACPTVIVADTDILKKAPLRLLQAGFGDMLAKYVSICEWRISHLVTGEYYCEQIASMVRSALKKCMHIEGLLERRTETIQHVMEGLILSGMAMGFAGLSRPASGIEHYFSHLWDMRALEYQKPSDLHGIQCGVATLIALRVYAFLRNALPNRGKAVAYAKGFSLEDWNGFLVHFLGKGAQTLIDLEKKESKYDLSLHADRLEILLSKWAEILQIIDEELPSVEFVEHMLLQVGAPTTPAELGHPAQEVKDALCATKDIRDKYIASRLLWDLGLLPEAMDSI